MDAPFNARKDLLNASSHIKSAFTNFKEKKISLRSELARGFNTRACKNNSLIDFLKILNYFILFNKFHIFFMCLFLVNEWVELLTNRNMDLVSGEEFIEDVSNIKGFSKLLQQWVLFIFFYLAKIFKNLFNFLLNSFKKR